MTLIHSERAKLTAAALDRASTACLTVGAPGPLVAVIDGPGVTASLKDGIPVTSGSALWLSAATGLYIMSRHHLREAEMANLRLVAYLAMPLVILAMGHAAARLDNDQHRRAGE